MLSVAPVTSTSLTEGDGRLVDSGQNTGMRFWDDLSGLSGAPAVGTMAGAERFFMNRSRMHLPSVNPSVHNRPTTLSAQQFAHRMSLGDTERQRLAGLAVDVGSEVNFLNESIERRAPAWHREDVNTQRASPRMSWEQRLEAGSPDWAARDKHKHPSTEGPSLGETLLQHALAERDGTAGLGFSEWEEAAEEGRPHASTSSVPSTAGKIYGALGGEHRGMKTASSRGVQTATSHGSKKQRARCASSSMGGRGVGAGGHAASQQRHKMTRAERQMIERLGYCSNFQRGAASKEPSALPGRRSNNHSCTHLYGSHKGNKDLIEDIPGWSMGANPKEVTWRSSLRCDTPIARRERLQGPGMAGMLQAQSGYVHGDTITSTHGGWDGPAGLAATHKRALTAHHRPSKRNATPAERAQPPRFGIRGQRSSVW